LMHWDTGSRRHVEEDKGRLVIVDVGWNLKKRLLQYRSSKY
jgi:hypothetical protein